jgi:hypothetical protein
MDDGAIDKSANDVSNAVDTRFPTNDCINVVISVLDKTDGDGCTYPIFNRYDVCILIE